MSQDLLASILAEFGTKPKGGANSSAAKPKAVKKPAPQLSRPSAFNLERTGYINWEPVSRTIFLASQECQCCGKTTTFVEQELFLVQHPKSFSRWYRREAHGIEQPQDLPIEIVPAGSPIPISCCPSCIQSGEWIETALCANQLSLEF